MKNLFSKHFWMIKNTYLNNLTPLPKNISELWIPAHLVPYVPPKKFGHKNTIKHQDRGRP